MKIYHNPRCSKSRQALQLLKDSGRDPEIVEYLKTPPSESELEQVLAQLGMEPQELMRTGEKLYKELGLKEKQLSRHEAIRLMVEHPSLIERPIIIDGDRAVVGRPPEKVKTLL